MTYRWIITLGLLVQESTVGEVVCGKGLTFLVRVPSVIVCVEECKNNGKAGRTNGMPIPVRYSLQGLIGLLEQSG